MSNGFWPGVICGLIAGAFIVLIAFRIVGIDVRGEAIAAGVAEWVLIDGGPESEFRWKEYDGE